MELRRREEMKTKWYKEGANVIGEKSEIRELADSETISPGIAVSSCVPAMGLWREYRRLLWNYMFS